MEGTLERILLRPAEAAQMIGISRSRAYELIASGELPSMAIGTLRRVPVDELRAWVARQIAASKGSSAA